MEYVILVDEYDNQIGVEEKIKAHRDARLHRCFSILIFNDKKELLIQQRAFSKYHCGGLWANSCCSHPRPGESTEDAAERRLMEELGFTTSLREKFRFIYKAEFDNGLTEHEFDHVFVGDYNKEIIPDPGEVADYKWVSVEELKEDVFNNPKKYSPWFRIILEEHLDKLT